MPKTAYIDTILQLCYTIFSIHNKEVHIWDQVDPDLEDRLQAIQAKN